MNPTLHRLAVFLLLPLCALAQTAPIRVLVIGAHPDDCDLNAGGLALLYAVSGHAVKFVSLTNGDKGHQTLSGKGLAARRKAEAQEAGRRFGVQYEVLDIPDGELLPTLENRLKVIRLIREWKADLVLAHRPNDYHPDHRYTGILVQDAAYLVIVPNILPEVPPLANNPVFLYTRDGFQRPNPFRPDVAVDISAVFQQKMDALDAHTSQVYEWLPWTRRDTTVPTDPQQRRQWLGTVYATRSRVTPAVKEALQKWYGPDRAATVAHAEAFELCEYGRNPSEEEIRRLFPMLGK